METTTMDTTTMETTTRDTTTIADCPPTVEELCALGFPLKDAMAEALRDEPGPTTEVLIKEARRRQRRRWAGVAVVLGVVGALLTGVAVTSGAPPPPRSPQSGHGDAPASSGAGLPSLQWPVQAVASTPDARSIVAATGDLFWLTGPDPAGCRGGSATVPVRYDPATGATLRGTPLAACTESLAVAGGSVWALERTGTSVVVASLDARTLAVTATEAFPMTAADPTCGSGGCAALAGGPGPVLWLSNGREIWRLDPASGAVEGSFTPVSTAAALAPAPTGSLLYASGANPTGGGAAIDEYRVPSGALAARAVFNQCLQTGPAQLAPGPGDVWVSCRTGMAGTASELTGNGLAVVPRPVTPTGSNGPFLHMMGVTIATSGPLWLSSIGDLVCADPATGTVLARESLPVTVLFGSHTALSDHLYAELGHSGVVEVHAPKSCFAG